ncbi:MAG: hypothetical protein DRP42_06795 [Tenericutes bacterium]|nr:MAG: hypothetical protein DRP42_06795 [Mycoplasmatota bacterium]
MKNLSTLDREDSATIGNYLGCKLYNMDAAGCPYCLYVTADGLPVAITADHILVGGDAPTALERNDVTVAALDTPDGWEAITEAEWDKLEQYALMW